MSEQQERIYEALCDMYSAKDVVDLIINVCGTQILNDDMEQELIACGHLEDEDED